MSDGFETYPRVTALEREDCEGGKVLGQPSGPGLPPRLPPFCLLSIAACCRVTTNFQFGDMRRQDNFPLILANLLLLLELIKSSLAETFRPEFPLEPAVLL